MSHIDTGDSGPRRVLDDSESLSAISPSSGAPQRIADDPARTGFFASSLWTILATIVPPVGLIRAGRKGLGWTLLVLAAIAVIGGAVVVTMFRRESVNIAATFLSEQTFMILGALLVLGAVAWIWIVGYTHLRTRPLNPKLWQRGAGALLVGLLAFIVAAPTAVAVRYTYDTASLLGTVFQSGTSQTRPTPGVDTEGEAPFDGRLNVLIMGGDDGFNRDESLGSRPDTVIVASINTETGDVVLFSMPRNTARMPFPPDSPLHEHYPDGFTNGDGDDAEYFLNAMYDNVPAWLGKDILGPTDNVGADVMKLSVGYALGLDIHYYVMINLDGFKTLIDALGGITVNVNERVPRGGSTDKGIPPPSWIEPGPDQHLMGTDALWYARGRYGTDDYHRMDRQRCVIDAVIRQADPVNILTRYTEIAAAGKEIIKTDIQASVLSSLVSLASAVQERGNIQSIVFKHGVEGFSSPNPDWDLVRQRVQAGIEAATPKSTPAPKPSAAPTTSATRPTTSTKPKDSTSPSATPSAATENLSDACAYNPRS